jgi:DNA-binding transcriptional LysR family regulator
MHSDDRFDGINNFVTVVRLGSFSAAAATLGVTGSGVGKSVSRLEARLGTKLLHRTTRQLTLTQEGTTYYNACLQVLGDLDETESSLSSGLQPPAGRLRVDLPAAFGRRHVLPALLALAAQYPRVDLSVTFTERTVDLINEGIDLAVRIGTLGKDADLVARRLGTQHLRICAAPSYLERHGSPIDKDELTQRDCIVGWRHQAPATWLLKECDGTETKQAIGVKHEFRDGEAMLSAVLAGAGLCQLPTWLIDEHLQSGALIPVLGQYAGGEMPIHVIWPRTRYVKTKMRVAIDALTELAAAPNQIFHPSS